MPAQQIQEAEQAANSKYFHWMKTTCGRIWPRFKKPSNQSILNVSTLELSLPCLNGFVSIVDDYWHTFKSHGTNQQEWGISWIHVIISKFPAPLCDQNGFCGEVIWLPQATKVPVSPKMSFITLDLTWMIRQKHTRSGWFQ